MSTYFPDKIGIVPRDFLADSLSRNPGKATVICCERNAGELPQLSKNFLQLRFDDILNDWFTQYQHEPKVKELIPPAKEHVEQALEFARLHQNRTIFISCHAGVNRSPAIAWAILFDRTKSVYMATEKLFQAGPFSAPNRDVIRFALEILAPGTGQYEYADQLLTTFEQKITSSSGWLQSASEPVAL